MNSGTEFFNYKSTFSIVLFALVDGNYNFMFGDVGCQGRISDAGVFRGSKLHSMLTSKTLGIPVPEELPGRSMQVPYFFVGDSAFALDENLMKPYHGDFAKGTPERIFNYRLSRARRIVENAFGISSSVFRVLRKPMLLGPEKAELIVMTVLLLHNYLRTHSPNVYTPIGTFDQEVDGVLTEGSWRREEADNVTSMVSLTDVPRRSTNY
uniref:Protein ALP1-like n=1 Tax=Diabrotica virgifera virgifera TaxID=50390 RepID=A0A6P7GJU7_DIAVI